MGVGMKYMCKREYFREGKILDIPDDAIIITIETIDPDKTYVEWLEPLEIEVELEPKC